jgi:hypothetical protein
MTRTLMSLNQMWTGPSLQEDQQGIGHGACGHQGVILLLEPEDRSKQWSAFAAYQLQAVEEPISLASTLSNIRIEAETDTQRLMLA